ncbi:MAG: methylated-DNA--[protein]-cysteine S-methyltransferase, partial [Burkholderiales bacterium]
MRMPFAVLGIFTGGGRLTGIQYLPKEAATLSPVNRLAERVCRQIERYLEDPGFRFDLPFDYRGTGFQC